MMNDPDPQAEYMLFYNVENLFQADPPPRYKGAPTDSGLRNWNAWRYDNKIQKLGSVFELFEANNGALPLVIGLSEVQGEQPLKDLVSRKPFYPNFNTVHYESMDERGVDTALLYDATKLELIASQPISYLFEIDDADPENYDKTRDILHCTFRFEKSVFHVFVCHLPSKRQQDINKPRREYMIGRLRETIAEIIIAKDEAVVVMGDFNSNPGEESLLKLLYDDAGELMLTNPFANLYINRNFSTFHHAEGLLFDQIFVSKHFLRSDSFLRYQSALVFSPDEIRSRDKRFEGRPSRTYAGTRYLGGYSDHFPVAVKFENHYNYQNEEH